MRRSPKSWSLPKSGRHSDEAGTARCFGAAVGRGTLYSCSGGERFELSSATFIA